MRPIWCRLVFAAALLALFAGGIDDTQAAGRGHSGGFPSGIGGGHVRGIGARFGARRFGLDGRRFGDARSSRSRFGRRFGRDYGGFGYGSSSAAYGGSETGDRARSDSSGYPVALGIRAAPSRPPTTYVVGSRADFAAARRGTMNRSRGRGPLMADSDDGERASGVDPTRPCVIRVP